MFKLKFQKKHQQFNPYYSHEFPDNESLDPDYADEYYSVPHDVPYQQGLECLFCNSPIAGAHLVVITKNNEYYLHPSCILSGFALIVNGFNLLIQLLFSRKSREE
ncbi:MAG: hypothetical protein E3K37_03275 [Candidatus Kuenenia sp.]|nr:hypothetical protein [Candidatus Kuenenia hertensis]